MITDDKKQSCSIFRIVPYLHERRIYLNKQNINTEYFYTSIDTPVESVTAYNKAITMPISQRGEIDITVCNERKKKPKTISDLREHRR